MVFLGVTDSGGCVTSVSGMSLPGSLDLQKSLVSAALSVVMLALMFFSRTGAPGKTQWLPVQFWKGIACFNKIIEENHCTK